MKTILSICIALAMMPLLGEDKVVESTGMGSTYRVAVNEALISALEMTGGLTLSASERTQITSSETSVVSSNGDDDRTTLNDSIAKDMKKWAEGKILGYDVLSEQFDPVTKKYSVQLSVRLPGAYVVGLDPANRRRMAVVPFRSETGDSIRWFGQTESSVMWTKALADKLNERFTQTRKFTMVDRKFDAEVNSELARLSGPNAAKADSVRLNQKLGTDYLVVGDVKFFPVNSPGVNPLTGRALPMTSQKFAEISYRVLLAATGQLKWADTIVMDAMEFQAADVVSFATATADGAATRIVDAIMASILPFEIVGRTPNGMLIVGEGGKSLAEGEYFTVYALGDEVTDTRTGEVLDQIEEPVGTVQIVRVTEKMSYAKFVDGDVSKVTVGSRLRRPKVQAAPPQSTAPVTTTIQGNGTGGVVAPF